MSLTRYIAQGIKRAAHCSHLRWVSTSTTRLADSGDRKLKEQSPIEILDTSIRIDKAFKEPLVYNNYWTQDGIVNMVNNGYTVDVIMPKSANPPTVHGGPLHGPFGFRSLHFHWGPTDDTGTEHSINGKKYSMEVHMVHESLLASSRQIAEKKYAVIALLLDAKLPYPHREFEHVIKHLPKIKEAHSISAISTVNVLTWLRSGLAPTGYYNYTGSLQVPSREDNVTWFVYPIPILVNGSQVHEFRKLTSNDKAPILNNCAELSPLNKRTVYFCPIH